MRGRECTHVCVTRIVMTFCCWLSAPLYTARVTVCMIFSACALWVPERHVRVYEDKDTSECFCEPLQQQKVCQRNPTPPHGTLKKPTRESTAKPIKHFHKDYHCILLIRAALFDAANALIFDGMTHFRWNVRLLFQLVQLLHLRLG